jgi:ABC-type Fe3+ transport system permease subunit
MRMGPNRGRLVIGAVAAAAALALLVLLLRRSEERAPAGFVSPTITVSAWPASGRLFLGSVGLAAGATAIAAALALPVGAHLGRRGGPSWALALVPLVLPPEVAAYVWRFTLDDLARLGGWRVPAGLGAAWTLASLYWPLMALPTAVVLRLRGRALAEELATLARPRAVFWRAVAPGLAPGFAAGAAVFFLLALSNYAVPLMWNVPSQSVAVFARLAAFYEPAGALRLSIPLLVTAALVCGAGLFWLARRPHHLDPNEMLSLFASVRRRTRRTSRIRGLGTRSGLSALVILLTAVAPVAALLSVPSVLAGWRSNLLAGGEAYQWGLVLAALGATGATALGLVLAAALRERGTAGVEPQASGGGHRMRRAGAALVELTGLCALFVPAAVVCLFVAGVFLPAGWLGALYGSLWVFPAAYGLRFFYIPWKLTRFAQRMETPAHRETARLMGLGWVWRTRLTAAGPLRPAVALGWLLVFALVMGELEIAAFLAQPGRQPLSVHLDNLMHSYARSAAVAQWSLMVVLTEVVLVGLVLAVGMRTGRG